MNRIKSFLAAPEFEDKELTRTARLLYPGFLLFIAFGAAFLIVEPWIFSRPGLAMVVTAIFSLACLFALILLRRGDTRTASILLSAVLWLLVTIVLLFSGGIHSPGYGSYMLIVLTAGMLLGWRTGLIFMGLSILTGFLMLLAEILGKVFPVSLLNQPISTFIVETTNISLIALLLYVIVYQVSEAKNRALQNELALEESNQTLATETLDRQRAEEATLEAAEKTRAVFETVEEGISVISLDGKFLDANQALIRLFRYQDKRELLARLPLELIIKEEQSRVEDVIHSVLATGKSRTLALKMVRKDGSTFLGEETLALIRDQVGKPIGIVSVIHDVTGHLLAEESLRIKSDAIASSINAIAISDLQGILTYVNTSFLEMWGYSTDKDVLGRNLEEFWEVKDKRKDVLKSLFENERWRGERAARKKDGTIFDVELSANLVTDEVDKPLCMMASFLDITERKRVEQALRESQDRFQRMANSIQDGITIVEDGRVVYFNDFACEILGYPRESFPHIDSLELAAPEELEWISKIKDEITRTGDYPTELEFWILRGDGIRRCIRNRYFQNRKKDGATIGRTIVTTDITEYKMAEQALQQANEQLVDSLVKLELRNRELTLLSEMGDLMGSCISLKEAYSVFAAFAPQLFPSQSGALYMINSSRNSVDAAVTWGRHSGLEAVFEPDGCWALRRGKIHKIEKSEDGQISGLVCQHINPDELENEVECICIPMHAQGETIGVFHLRGEFRQDLESWDQPATTVAEHLAMLISNLALRESLRMQSVRDPLTGLFNRRYMEESMERELGRASRYQSPLGVLMVDIDHFKEYNDTFGHAAGDALLQSLGNYLMKNLRAVDIACRYGGEEFALILPDTSMEDSCLVAEKIWRGLQNLYVEFRGKTLGNITVSIGVAGYPGNGTSVEELLQASDTALYQAKHEGRNRIAVRV